MPEVAGLLETALWVADVPRACDFYEQVLGLRKIREDERGGAFAVPGGPVLLLSKQGSTREPKVTPGGVVPPCGASGSMHVAFAVPRSEMEAWRSWLESHGVEVESEVHWEHSGRSLYFRDPDGHLLELGTPGLWDSHQASVTK